jgi:hypothetical protein
MSFPKQIGEAVSVNTSHARANQRFSMETLIGIVFL